MLPGQIPFAVAVLVKRQEQYASLCYIALGHTISGYGLPSVRRVLNDSSGHPNDVTLQLCSGSVVWSSSDQLSIWQSSCL